MSRCEDCYTEGHLMSDCWCLKKPKPHKHAALIKAWADGAEIEFKCTINDGWIPTQDNCPEWLEFREYRIKPTPKPDFRKYAHVGEVTRTTINTVAFREQKYGADEIELTFDGETGKLKSVKLIKE